jgi:hypothetical protein
MIQLVYRLKLTHTATQNMAAFWSWAAGRECWFYSGVEILGTQWRVRADQESPLIIEHTVSFVDEAALARYRHQIAARSQDPDWENRRTEQDRWWTVLGSAVFIDPPANLFGAGRRSLRSQSGREADPRREFTQARQGSAPVGAQ